MVKTAQTKNADDMLEAINSRKESLEYQLALQGPKANKQVYAKELQYLLDLVQNIEADDFDGMADTL